jgi:hypothetical protein
MTVEFRLSGQKFNNPIAQIDDAAFPAAEQNDQPKTCW